jgi:uncharacterized membrane protein YdjX (TVP38/TMEM64 family)
MPTGRLLARVGIAVAVVAGLGLLWRTTGLGDWIEPERLHGFLRSLADSPWAIPVVWGAFVAAGLLMLPVNALFVAVGLAFGLVEAMALSMSGALLSTLVVDVIGRRFDMDPLLVRGPGWMLRWKRAGLEHAGIAQLVVMRLLPLGPFGTVNLVWAAAGVPRRRVLIATFVGLVPGITATSAIGEGLGLGLASPSGWSTTLLVGGCLGLLALALVGRRLLRSGLGDVATAEDESPPETATTSDDD